MDQCCYDCPANNCTVRELLQHVSSVLESNYRRYGSGTEVCDIAVTISSTMFYILFITFILTIVIVVFYCVCKKKCRRNKEQSNGQQNEENTGTRCTCDVINNEAQVTVPEKIQNEAYVVVAD